MKRVSLDGSPLFLCQNPTTNITHYKEKIYFMRVKPQWTISIKSRLTGNFLQSTTYCELLVPKNKKTHRQKVWKNTSWFRWDARQKQSIEQSKIRQVKYSNFRKLEIV
jgi:hypothetical protein